MVLVRDNIDPPRRALFIHRVENPGTRYLEAGFEPDEGMNAPKSFSFPSVARRLVTLLSGAARAATVADVRQFSPHVRKVNLKVPASWPHLERSTK